MSGPRPAADGDREAARRSGAGTALGVAGLSVMYGANTAVDGLTFGVDLGQVSAMVGPNGSGKTSTLNALTGLVGRAAGSICLLGQEQRRITPQRAYRQGLTRTFQHLDLMPDLTVEENIAFGAQVAGQATLAESMLALPRSWTERARRKESARHAAELFGITAELDRRVSELPYGIRRKTEVARAVAGGPKLLLMDEPTAGMGPAESAEFGSALRRLVDELPLAILVIEHDMSVVRSAADEVWVLSNGALIAAGPPKDVLDMEIVVETYLGKRADL